MFYVVMATVKPGVTIEDVQTALEPAMSWYRIAPNVWIINTFESASTWQTRLKDLVSPTGRLFISRLDTSDRQGWMDKKFWDWLRSHN